MKKIVIVGGGSSGWMTASYLNHLYNKHDKNVQVTLIESKDIDILGVGEATVPTLRTFFQALGFDEAEVMRETNATFKNGILFRGWNKPIDGKTHEYLHPFEMQKFENRYDISTEWLLNSPSGNNGFAKNVCLTQALVEHEKAPKVPNIPPYQGVVHYGYHLDARLLGQYLRKKSLARGVERIEANVEHVVTDNNQITCLKTTAGEIVADLYIDCTGFKALLLSHLEQDNWRSFAKELLCDRAVTIQTPYSEGETPKPYTISTAQSNGWTWEIGLKERKGTGYVYSSKHLTKEQAEQELRDYIGCGDDLKAMHIDMNIGCRKEHWIGNCVAIGLSGGFIEPLESTGLHLIHMSNYYLTTHYTDANDNQTLRDSYNSLINSIYDDLKEFIVLHYTLTNRDDTDFWKQAAKTGDECPRLKQRLDVWRHKVCENYDLGGSPSTLFTELNYKYVLYGMQYYPTLNMPYRDYEFNGMREEITYRQNKLLEMTETHASYLAKM